MSTAAIDPTRVTTLEPAHREALEQLVDATYRLNLAVATSDLDEAVLREARAQLDAVSDRLGARTRTRAMRNSFEAPRQARREGTPYRLCGYTPWGVPIEARFEDDGQAVRSRFVPNALHEGPPDGMHGGVGGYLMDCVLGILIQAQDKRAVTARLEIDYRARTPLDQEMELYGRITRREGRKIWAEGWIESGGTRTLEASGLFIEIEHPVVSAAR
ncbi:acyl-coenzyme A thioesterase PaaI-like protein [Nocardioides massiliensis]|uniref:Acyl-coenzyme A thioesterase PaaI-like protein n=3 Tax=Nocardioides massiliensis TaxID=1325935 RepID=A0ABT9NU51_9ACTN|nr:PaaI family thioesterase [Nocardioides massiliensis]MDP9823960.1 acyl-coenzyme A thioesterase PaaI-like protein [Nocardioides massiliensis]